MVTATVAAVAESRGSMPRSPSTVTPLTPSTRASRASASVTRLAFESRGTRTVRIAVAVESLWSGLEDAQTVAPSKIGSQFYCEEKVALEREHGEIETPEKQRGSETHEKAAEDAVEDERAEMWDAIERGERQVLLETPFVGEAADFVVVGIPDAVVFDEGDPQLTFDRKTTSILSRLFKSQRIQVWLYGYMLQSLGFAVDDLQLAILAHEQHLDPETGKQLPPSSTTRRLTSRICSGRWSTGEKSATRSRPTMQQSVVPAPSRTAARTRRCNRTNSPRRSNYQSRLYLPAIFACKD
jgi:hypothetical protein